MKFEVQDKDGPKMFCYHDTTFDLNHIWFLIYKLSLFEIIAHSTFWTTDP